MLQQNMLLKPSWFDQLMNTNYSPELVNAKGRI